VSRRTIQGILLGLVIGIAVGIGAYTFAYAKGWSYLTAGQFELVLVFNLLQSISIMTNVFAVFRKYLVECLTPNTKRIRAYVDASVGVITAINPHVGYETAARIAREAIVSGTPVRELILRDNLLTPEQLDSILDHSR
jgi:aspartate ammonia-lyase